MRFTSESQRRAVMAQLHTGGTTTRAKSIWGTTRNPYEDVVMKGAGKRGSVTPREGPSAAVTARGRAATGVLAAAGFTSGLGKRGITKQAKVIREEQRTRRQAFRQFAQGALVTAAITAPLGYVALRTGLGNRAALAVVRRVRPLGGMRAITGHGRELATLKAGEAVTAGERAIQNRLRGAVDRGVTRITGVSDIPAELAHAEGLAKSRFMFATNAGQKEAAQRSLEGINRRVVNLYTGPGLLDRADRVFKGGLRRIGLRLGLPVTGSLQRRGSQLSIDPTFAARAGIPIPDPVTRQGDWEGLLTRHNEVAKTWRTLRRRGSARLGDVSLTRLSGGTIRRRGGSLATAPFSPLAPIAPKASSIKKLSIGSSSLAGIAERNARTIAELKTRLPSMSRDELRKLQFEYPQLRNDIGKYLGGKP